MIAVLEAVVPDLFSLGVADLHGGEVGVAGEEEVAWYCARLPQDEGPVLEVIEQPHQVLCRLEIETKEVLIPINEQTLNKVDHKSRSLLLTLPDGLLEVYLS
jgi:hypothetical protein